MSLVSLNVSDFKNCIKLVEKLHKFIWPLYQVYQQNDEFIQEYVKRLPMDEIDATVETNMDFIRSYVFDKPISDEPCCWQSVSIIYHICQRMNKYYSEYCFKRDLIVGQIYLTMKEISADHNIKYLFEGKFSRFVEKRLEFMPVEILQKIFKELKMSINSEIELGSYIQQLHNYKKITEPIIGECDSFKEIIDRLLLLLPRSPIKNNVFSF